MMKNLMMTTTAFMAVWSAMSAVGLANPIIVDDFSTGYDNASGNLINYNNNDSDWSIVSAPDGVVLGQTRVVNFGSWFNPDPDARWIVPQLENGSTNLWNLPTGNYLFEYRFDLNTTASNFYLSAELGVDNRILANGIQLNGNPLTFSISSTSNEGHNFQLPFNLSFETDNQSFFNEGENTLSIHVRNLGTINNPIGLVIDGNVTAIPVTPVPEPSTLIGLLTVGVLGVTSGLSKKQQK